MVIVTINWRHFTPPLDAVGIKPPKLLKHPYPKTGKWVLRNGFSIETGGWNFICNLFFLNSILID